MLGAMRAQRLGRVAGVYPHRKFLSFRRSEIDSGAFWGTFPRQDTRTNLRCVLQNISLWLV